VIRHPHLLLSPPLRFRRRGAELMRDWRTFEVLRSPHLSFTVAATRPGTHPRDSRPFNSVWSGEQNAMQGGVTTRCRTYSGYFGSVNILERRAGQGLHAAEDLAPRRSALHANFPPPPRWQLLPGNCISAITPIFIP